MKVKIKSPQESFKLALTERRLLTALPTSLQKSYYITPLVRPKVPLDWVRYRQGLCAADSPTNHRTTMRAVDQESRSKVKPSKDNKMGFRALLQIAAELMKKYHRPGEAFGMEDLA